MTVCAVGFAAISLTISPCSCYGAADLALHYAARLQRDERGRLTWRPERWVRLSLRLAHGRRPLCDMFAVAQAYSLDESVNGTPHLQQPQLPMPLPPSWPRRMARASTSTSIRFAGLWLITACGFGHPAPSVPRLRAGSGLAVDAHRPPRGQTGAAHSPHPVSLGYPAAPIWSSVA